VYQTHITSLGVWSMDDLKRSSPMWIRSPSLQQPYPRHWPRHLSACVKASAADY